MTTAYPSAARPEPGRSGPSDADAGFADLAARIEAAFARRGETGARPADGLDADIAAGLDALDAGRIRAARREGRDWVAVPWVKELILLSFRDRASSLVAGLPGQPQYFDKLDLRFEGWDAERFRDAGIRVVPGAVVRRGAHVARNVVLMPCFVNIGAFVGESTMVDTWATIGSCAQVGARCHISGGAGIGGVLEPIGEAPVVVEDDVFVGARSEIAEGVVVRKGAVISMGVYLGRTTPIVDRANGEILYGEVPENAVVVPGARQDPRVPGLSTYAAVIVKRADERTRGRTALETLVRDRD